MYNARIQKIDSSGNYMTQFSYVYSHDSGTGFERPKGIAVDGNGDLFIADRGNKRIVKCDADGDDLFWSLQPGARLYDPIDIAIGSGNVLFVLDGNRIVKLGPTGGLLEEWECS